MGKFKIPKIFRFPKSVIFYAKTYTHEEIKEMLRDGSIEKTRRRANTFKFGRVNQ